MGNSSICVTGIIGIDEIITSKHHECELLGGSGSFAALGAAAVLSQSSSVGLLSIVGCDFPLQHESLFSRWGVDLSLVERSDLKSFRWCGAYEKDMNQRRTVSRELNVLEHWSPRWNDSAPVPDVLVLSCATSATNLDILRSFKRRPRIVLSDTMDIWITSQREMTDAVVAQSDIFVLNESEAVIYSGKKNMVEAGESLLKLGAPYVIIKLGEYGAMLFYRDALGCLKLFRCAAFPLRSVVDPTGAGDSFLGALGGYLSSVATKKLSPDDIKVGMAYGSVVASFICEGFEARGLEKAGKEGVKERFTLFRELTSW